MTRIASVFAGRKDAALIAFITVGYPSLEATVEAVPLLEACGVDMVELGIFPTRWRTALLFSRRAIRLCKRALLRLPAWRRPGLSGRGQGCRCFL